MNITVKDLIRPFVWMGKLVIGTLLLLLIIPVILQLIIGVAGVALLSWLSDLFDRLDID